ncbi:MAG: polyprenyl synthetase family protein [Deltaproteobacteria bacterium]
MRFDIESYLTERRNLIDRKIDFYLKGGGPSHPGLIEAMRYSALAGGKRLRPILMIAASEAVGGEAEKVLPVACAVEMIHTYSLIHDDLPSMDDDSLRRGIPTNHNVFGEATAILAGDALLTDAFNLMVREGLSGGIDPMVICEVVMDVSHAAGSSGMIEGQAMDLALEGTSEVAVGEVERMHALKTGAIIKVSVTAGARIGGADEEQLEKFESYARSIGLAYQIIDDVLDIEGGKKLGKERGADAKRRKSTYPELVGLEESRRKVSELTQNALRQLRDMGPEAEALREIAVYLGCRNY